MDDNGETRIPRCHVAELSQFFAAHDRWLFGHACVRTRGDPELAADLVQDVFEAAARAWTRLRGHADDRQRAWLLGTLANKDVSDFRRREAFRRGQPDIQARYQGTAADTAAQALNAIALERAREIIEDMPGRALEQCLPPESFAVFQATCGDASTRLTVMSERLRVLSEQSSTGSAADPYAPATLSTSVNRQTLREVLAVWIYEKQMREYSYAAVAASSQAEAETGMRHNRLMFWLYRRMTGTSARVTS